MQKSEKTILKIRHGMNGYKYAACTASGRFIANFEKLADVRRYWLHENHNGACNIIRELNKYTE